MAAMDSKRSFQRFNEGTGKGGYVEYQDPDTKEWSQIYNPNVEYIEAAPFTPYMEPKPQSFMRFNEEGGYIEYQNPVTKQWGLKPDPNVEYVDKQFMKDSEEKMAKVRRENEEAHKKAAETRQQNMEELYEKNQREIDQKFQMQRMRRVSAKQLYEKNQREINQRFRMHRDAEHNLHRKTEHSAFPALIKKSESQDGLDKEDQKSNAGSELRVDAPLRFNNLGQ